jgi:hypothetical protein
VTPVQKCSCKKTKKPSAHSTPRATSILCIGSPTASPPTAGRCACRRPLPPVLPPGHSSSPAPSSRFRPATACRQSPAPAAGPFLPALARPESADVLRHRWPVPPSPSPVCDGGNPHPGQSLSMACPRGARLQKGLLRRRPPLAHPSLALLRTKEEGRKTHVASLCLRCFIGMLQMFYKDVAKVDQDVAYIVMVVHVCCKPCSKCFIYFSDICCKYV